MKVNTDGLLLGALAGNDQVKRILDIGSGTGVIALMLAQRYKNVQIDAVEIDSGAAKTAGNNFKNSPFSNRLTIYPGSFELFLNNNPDKKYDLIVSNPPFFINSLKPILPGTQLAKHTDETFFERLVSSSASHLKDKGVLSLILPASTAAIVTKLAQKTGLTIVSAVNIHSFVSAVAHRKLLNFSFEKKETVETSVVIYDELGKYSAEYCNLLTDFLTIF